MGKMSEWMYNFWMVRFLKTESESISGFRHIPISYHTLIM